MNLKLEQFKSEIKHKKVAVIGIGVSNRPLIRYLRALEVNVTAFDRMNRDQIGTVAEEFDLMGVQLVLGEHYLENLKGYDYLFKSPGMRFDMPQFVKAVSEGAILTSEMEVFMDICPAPVIAVTGSDGKTTTTTLIYEMLKKEGYICWLGGNIGMPLLDKIDQIEPNHKVILELSSFQLHTMKKSPNVAVITNLSPNHLDIHKDMDEYIDAKKNIFRYQRAFDKIVLNYDNPITRAMAQETPGEVVFFSRRLMEQAFEMKASLTKRISFIKNGHLTFLNAVRQLEKEDLMADHQEGITSKAFCKAEDIKIPGVHNIENYLAAIAAVEDMVTTQTVEAVAASFGGVEHRNELVRELNGVRYYNDSIGSSPARTVATLNSFDDKVILIAGGYDKKIPYDIMGELIYSKVKILILMGQTGKKIQEAYEQYLERFDLKGKITVVPVIQVNSMQDAVAAAYLNAGSGDIVVLSPASASFDMFRNFEERGRLYKDAVNTLK